MNDRTRILVVEDEAIVAVDLKLRLELMGYQVTATASSSQDALEQVEKTQPDLVLMDIRLEGNTDGIETAQYIRRQWRLPVVFLTAYSDNTTLERARLAEPFGYILKPFEDRELKTTIAIALYKHKTDKEIRRLNRLYASLSQINQAIVRIKTDSELLQVCCRLLVQYGEFRMAWINRLDPGTHQLQPVGRWGEENEKLEQIVSVTEDYRHGQSPASAAVLQEQPGIVNNIPGRAKENSWCAAAAAAGLQSAAAFPIRFQNILVFVLTVCSDEADFFQEKEIHLLEEVSLDLVFALDNLENDSRRRGAEQALKASEEKFRGLFETMVEAVAIHEIIYDDCGTPVDYRIIDVNPSFIRITEIPREKIIGNKASEVYMTGAPPYFEIYSKVAATGEPEKFETYFPPMKKYFSITAFSPGKGLFDTIFEDITVRKQTEEQLQLQVEELQRWHKVTLGRENRVLELKHEVNDLLARLGEPARYAE